MTLPTDGKGLRYDDGKNRLELIPPEWEWELGEVLTAGAIKYAERNWERGMKWSKCVGPLKRHLNKWLRGEMLDIGTPEQPGTRRHHMAMVAWNALVLMTYELRGIGEDDLGRADHNKVLDQFIAAAQRLKEPMALPSNHDMRV